MKSISAFCLIPFIFFACSKLSNSPTSVSGGDTPGSDTIPSLISILYGDSLYGTRGYVMPGDLAVVVKNKEGAVLTGIPVSFRAGFNCGFASPNNSITNPAGYSSFFWTLGISSDSIQTLKARLQNDTNVSVTFHAIAQDVNRYRFIGTLRITSSSGVFGGYIGAPDFPNLSDNTDLPFIVDSLTNIISTDFNVDSLGYITTTLNFPMVLTINGHVVAGAATPNNGKTLAQDGNLTLGGTAGEYKTYANATGGGIYSYGEDWTFTGTLVNNVYSGTFSLQISVATKYSSGEIYNSYSMKYGTFTTILQ